MDAILLGFQVLFANPINLVLLAFGIFMGIFFGAIPGLTATLGVCLMIPFTYKLAPVAGITLLVSIYVGGISGGLITATLINIPGTPSSIFTCWDGYPMTKKGKPDIALALGVTASLIGGTFSAIILFGIAPQLAKVALYFNNWEYFAVSLMGVAIVVGMSGNDLLRSLIGAIIGLILGAVGLDVITGSSRLCFNHWQLQGGITSTALMMGLFAIREIFDQTKDMHKPREKIHLKKVSFLPPWKELKQCGRSLLGGCCIGTGIGILPGIGQNAATILSYNYAKSVSKHPEEFGKGSPEGICASESSNNAVNGGALIPLLTLGIPGDMTTAMMIGGLMIHGIQPGPLLFRTNVDVVGATMAVYFIANFVMYLMELGLMKVFVKMINIKLSLLFPAIILCCVLGVFAMNNRIFDVWILIAFGIFGYILKQLNIDLTPVILGYILGPIVEKYYRLGMISANGNFLDLFTRPVAAIFFIVSILFIVVPYTRLGKKAKKAGFAEC